MAFNFQTFQTRALTAIVFVVVMLGGLLYNQWSFFLLFSIIHFGCWIEYQKLIALIYPAYVETSKLHRNTIMLLGWAFLLFNAPAEMVIGKVSLQGIGWYGIMLLTIVFCLTEILLKKQLDVKSLIYSALGLLYISLSWSLMIALRNFPIHYSLLENTYGNFGWVLPVVLIAAIWINDTMQYLVGSFIGKTPFSSISPKKTWEGTIGGSLLAIITIGLAAYWWLGASIIISFGIPTIAAVIGTLGDLLESKIKRLANVKDSGQIMPGHGGFLDRFDSLLLATPFVWLLVYLQLLLG